MMKEQARTNPELIEENSFLKQRIQELEISEAERKRVNDALRESEEKYRILLSESPDPIFSFTPEGQYRYVNRAFAEGVGKPAEDIIGKSIWDVFSKEEADKRFASLSQVFRTGEEKVIEVCVPRVDGDRYYMTTITPIKDTKGKMLSVVCSSKDITDRKRAEEALQESEELFRVSMERAPDGVYMNDFEGNFLYGNRKAEEIIGYRREELIGGNFLDLNIIAEGSLIKAVELLKANSEGKSTSPDELELIRKDGRHILIEVNTTALQRRGKKAVLGFVRDITDRKQAEELLCKAEQEKSAILDAMSEIVIYLNTDMRIIWSNSAMTRQFNMKPEQVKGRYCYEVLHKLNRPCKICPVVKAIETGEPHTIDGFSSYGKRWTLRAYPVRNGEEEIVGVVEIVTDITEHKLAEEALRESQQQLSDIIEFLPDATLVIDKEGKVIAWNRAVEAMTGIKKEEVLGKGNYEYSLPFYGDRRPILIDLALHPDREMEKQYTAIQRVGDILFGESFTPNLPPGDIHLSATASVLRNSKGEIFAAIECIRDNSERRRLEERLNRAEKMEGLGRLAGGVAHDLNNVLGVMVGYSELLAEKLPVESPLKSYANNIYQSSLRGAAIIQDLLTLARRGVTVSEVVDLNRVVFNYLRTPEFEKLKSYHQDVKIWTEIAEGLLNIKGSPVHLGKTIMNLVSNAVEAIADQGEVTISTENRYLDYPLRGYDEIQEGDYVVLTVSDTGSGISTNDISKIFEPFYTKKVMGRSGTGLGLAVVWGTVKDHNGYIDVQSEEGKGSAFTLYFPATREDLAKVQEAISIEAYMGRSESILIVDDVKEQREVAISMLVRLGYQAEAVSSGEKAIEYLNNRKADLVILDMIMDPGIDGMETYRRILEINPGQKAILVSGFSESDRVRKAQEMGAGAFVRKPYILEKIGLAIRKELDRK